MAFKLCTKIGSILILLIDQHEVMNLIETTFLCQFDIKFLCSVIFCNFQWKTVQSLLFYTQKDLC